MTPQDVIDSLHDPKTLMRRASLGIAGGAGHMGANGNATECTFKVSLSGLHARGFTTGMSGLVGRRKNRPKVSIMKLSALSNPAPADHFNAYYIPMVQVGDVANNTSHYTLPTVGGPDIAITSMLTGCVFSLGSDANGAIVASHVQPMKSTLGANATDPQRMADLGNRQTQARNAGAQGFVANPTQFSHGASYDLMDEKVAIIGVRTGINWKFYAQRVQKDSFQVRCAVEFFDG